jgi:hypothetical protein
MSWVDGRGKDVKFREMIRRMPIHYSWKNKDDDGGQWKPRKFPFVSLIINTTHHDVWEEDLKEQIKRLIK